MDSCQVGVLKKAHKVCLCCFLQGKNCRGLEPQVSLEVLSNLTHEPLERELADQQLCRLLVLPDLSEGNGSRPVSVRLQAEGGTSDCVQVGKGGASASNDTVTQTNTQLSYRKDCVYLLDAPSSGCALPGSLGSQLLTRSLATGRLASSLFCTCHVTLGS